MSGSTIEQNRPAVTMVGVGRGVKVPAEFKDEYVAARKRAEDAHKAESRLFRSTKGEGPEYEAAVRECQVAHNVLVSVVDKIRVAIGAPGVQPPPPRPGRPESDFVRAKRSESSGNAAKLKRQELLPMYAPFGPGWDAKAKGDLTRAARGEEFEPKVHRFGKDEALALLKQIPTNDGGTWFDLAKLGGES